LARFTGAAKAHKVTCDSNFNAYIYGIGFFESYGFTAGTKINDLNSYPSFRNSFKTLPSNDTITCPKTPFRVAVQVAYPLTSITWNLSQTPGISFDRDTTIVNPIPTGTSIIYGRKYYQYGLDVDLFFSLSGAYDLPYSYTSPEIDQCARSETGNLHITVSTGPKADFDTTKSFCLSDDVQLISTSNDNGFNIIRHQWDFQDGSNIITKDAIKKFPTSGKHPVRYRIFSDNGCTGDTIKNMIVLDEQMADFTITGPPCKDSTLTFTSKISTPPNTTLWCWQSLTGKVDSTRLSPGFSFIFNSVGKDIPIKHWVIDANGCKSTTKELKIKEIFNSPNAPKINIMSDTLCIGYQIKIDATIFSTAKSWKWDIESIGQSASPSPVNVIYQQSGTYNIQLSYVSSEGCGSLTGTQSVTIFAAPKADAGSDVYINAGSFAPLEPRMSPPNAFLYEWTPSIGLSDPKIHNPVCTPLTDTIYAMRVWDKTTLCHSTDSVRVIILDQKRIPNTFTPNNDGINDLWELKFLERCMECRAEVYNTSGMIVWRSTPGKSFWDGRLNGRDLPVGTYYFVIKMAGDNTPVTGFVTIIR
jgi:gliding motility-associated-like protein